MVSDYFLTPNFFFQCECNYGCGHLISLFKLVHIGASFIGRAHVPILLQLAMSKRDEENKSRIYMLEGSENLGSYLRIQPCSDKVPLLSKCSIQWYRLSYEGSWKELISGMHSISLLLLVSDHLCSSMHGHVESNHFIWMRNSSTFSILVCSILYLLLFML